MYYFYAIKSGKDGTIYKGISKNPLLRLKQHNSGKTKSTKNKIPFSIVYLERCESREGARKREKYFKSGFGREELKNKIA